MKLTLHLTRNTLLYIFRILLGCYLTWALLSIVRVDKREWALISVIIVSEPDFENLRSATASRVINTLNGCVVGLLFLLVAGVNFYSLLGAVAVSSLIGTSFPKYPSSWKVAPVTVVIVMITSILGHFGLNDALRTALTRTGEVLIGCGTAFLLGWAFSYLPKKKEGVSLIEAPSFIF